jgi:hypothetical protein
MAASLYNLARMTTGTTGAGTITLGSAVSGFLSFSAAGVSDGETVTYAIQDGTTSEIGRGVYTASGTTLTRSVLKSTNSNAAISLSGSAQVFITAAAEDFSVRTTAETTFGADNRIVRSDGTGRGVQSSAITVDDSGNLSGVGTINGGRGVGLPINAGLACSVAANALTIALKTFSGSDASATDVAYVPAHSGSGAVTWRSVTAALSITVPSATTIGTVSGIASPVYVYAIDNAGAIELAVSLKYHGQHGVVTTTAISGGGTSTTMYSTTARTSVPFSLIGVAYSTQTTAGTWASAPTDIQLVPLTLKNYGFRADRSGNQTGWENATLTKVQLNATAFDADTAFDSTTNYRFTCQEPGTYNFTGAGTPNAAHLATTYVYKNGAISIVGKSYNAGDLGVSIVAGPLVLVPGDYVELYMYQNSGSTQTIYGINGYTWLAGGMLR